MIVLALLLLALAIALVVVVVVESGYDIPVEVLNVDADAPLWAVFVAGVATGVITLAGVVILAVGIRRSQARAKEIEYLRRRVAAQEKTGEDADGEGVGEWMESGRGRNRLAGQPETTTATRPAEPAGGGATPSYRTP